MPSRRASTPPSARRRLELFERDLGLPGVVEFGRYRYASAQEGLREHAHPGCLEICLLARGRQTYRVRGAVYRLRGGDQYVVFPGERHDSAESPEEKGVLYWVLLRLRPARGPLLFLDTTAAAELRRALAALPARHFAAEPGAEELLEKFIATLTGARTPLARIEAGHLLASYLFKTLRAAHRRDVARPSPRIQRCLDHLAAHADRALYVPDLARLVGLSESRFKVRFRREAGLPPGEAILRAKIDAARERLRARGATVTSVAHALGFSSSQYFATVFRRFTGVSPSEHRLRATA